MEPISMDYTQIMKWINKTHHYIVHPLEMRENRLWFGCLAWQGGLEQTQRELKSMGVYFFDSELIMCQRDYEQWLQLAENKPLEELEISFLVSDEQEKIYDLRDFPQYCTEPTNINSNRELKPLSTKDIQMLLIRQHEELEKRLMTAEIMSERVAVDYKLTQLENAIAEIEVNR